MSTSVSTSETFPNFQTYGGLGDGHCQSDSRLDVECIGRRKVCWEDGGKKEAGEVDAIERKPGEQEGGNHLGLGAACEVHELVPAGESKYREEGNCSQSCLNGGGWRVRYMPPRAWPPTQWLPMVSLTPCHLDAACLVGSKVCMDGFKES